MERLARSFWFLPAVAIVAAVGLVFALEAVDRSVAPDLGLFSFGDADSARSVLTTIATVTVSVVGIAFSVVVVALQLSSQQLSPRVLRTFQNDRLNQATLAAFLGAAVYSLVLLTQLSTGVPEIAVFASIVWALAALGLFVAFVEHAITSLQAATVIARIAADGREALEGDYPAGVGSEPEDAGRARERADARRAEGAPVRVAAEEGGYLTDVRGDDLLRAARREDALVVQRVPVGDYVVTGQQLAEAWVRGDAEALADEVRAAFRTGTERTTPQDLAFSIRQLADIALRALSPGINDPTTAENAMDAMTDVLVRVAGAPRAALLRVDEEDEPRFLACRPSLDDLLDLGFEQVTAAASEHPVFVGRLVHLLGEVDRAAREAGATSDAARRHADRLAERPVSERS